MINAQRFFEPRNRPKLPMHPQNVGLVLNVKNLDLVKHPLEVIPRRAIHLPPDAGYSPLGRITRKR